MSAVVDYSVRASSRAYAIGHGRVMPNTLDAVTIRRALCRYRYHCGSVGKIFRDVLGQLRLRPLKLMAYVAVEM